MILAIDPGRDTGWALIENGKLVDCGLGDPRPCKSRPVTHVLIERPQIYQGRASKANPNDLITLAIMVGRYTEVFDAFGVEHILPHDWKGTVDPDVLDRRIRASLTDEERQVLETKLVSVPRGKQHNVVDAVGLGKWSLRRTRAGVF